MANEYIQLPPDSTGKRVVVQDVLALDYVNGTIDFKIGEHVFGQLSNMSGTVSRKSGTTSNGTIYVLLDDDAPVAQSGENLQVEGITHAEASGIGSLQNVQPTILAGGNNPYFHQTVDIYGQAAVRFAEGSPLFDAFGNTKVTTPQQMGDYTFAYNSNIGVAPDNMQETIVGTGATNHLPLEASVQLQCSLGNNDLADLTTNRYHQYIPGNSQMVMMTVTVGDIGKTNVTRQWGYFNAGNGIFFELNDTTMNVVLRTSTSGAVTETRIPQVNWNTDRVNGAFNFVNKSKITLDISNINIYWMDFQWLGGGRIRMGIFSERGERVTVHEFRNANNITGPFMATPNLPVCIRQFNTGAAASTSEMKLTCATVKTEGSYPENQKRLHRLHSHNTNSGGSITVSTTILPLLSLRSTANIGAVVNRYPSIPEKVTIYTDQPIQLFIYSGAVVTGGTWSLHGSSAVDFSEGATAVTGNVVYHVYLDAGSHNIDISDHFSYRGDCMTLLADGSYGNVISFAANKVTATDAAVNISVGWYDHGV